MQKSQLKVIGAAAAVAVIAGGGFGVWSVMKDDDGESVLVSAEDGAAARAERDLRLPAGAATGDREAASLTIAADEPPLDCDFGSEPYVPSEEELATANADTDALAAVLDKYGVTYQSITDPSGFRYIENDYRDVVAVSVVSSFWDDRYPALAPTQAELDEVIARNDMIAAALDEAGLAYTRSTDSGGWDNIEWDYENPDAQAVVDAVYNELYPPEPPTAEQVEIMTAENDELAAAFDAAGVEYTRISDEIGWEWIEWDYDDAEMNKKVDAVFAELYQSETDETCPTLMDDAARADDAPAVDEIAPIDESESTVLPEEQPVDFTPEEVAQRDFEADALLGGFEAAGVEVRMEGESPWQVVLFDVNDDAAVEVVASVLAGRG